MKGLVLHKVVILRLEEDFVPMSMSFSLLSLPWIRLVKEGSRSYWCTVSNIIWVQTNNTLGRSRSDKATYSLRCTDHPRSLWYHLRKRTLTSWVVASQAGLSFLICSDECRQLSSVGWRGHGGQHRQCGQCDSSLSEDSKNTSLQNEEQRVNIMKTTSNEEVFLDV